MNRGRTHLAIATILLISLVLSIPNSRVMVWAKIYSFTATISPTVTNVNQQSTYSMTITNTGESLLGSASITIPAGFTVLSPITIAAPSSGWNYTLSASTISVTGLSGSDPINPGQSVVFNFNGIAPVSPGITTWTTDATANIGGGGVKLTLNGTQPTVTVISPFFAPTISASPLTINQGQVSFVSQTTVPSGGTPPYNYQWFNAFNGGPFSPIAGANGSNYTFATTTATSTGTWSFKLNVTDSFSTPSTVTSNTVNIIVNSALAAPGVTATPNAITQGQTSSLTSTAMTTGTSPYTYQWFQKAPSSNYAPVGSNSPTYNFPGSTTIGTWTFLLQVTDNTGAKINSTGTEVIINPTPVFIITVIQGAHGTIIPGTTNVNYGSSQTFTIQPDPGYHIANVIVDSNPVGPLTSYTFTGITTNHTITATFTIDTYVIEALAGPNGAIDPAGTVIVDWNATQNFIIAPNEYYHISGVIIDGISIGPVYSFNFTEVTSNHNITAFFAMNTDFFIQVISAHGSPTPSTGVNTGENFTASVIQIEGTSSQRWVCIGYSIDGAPITQGTSHSFTNIQENHNITFYWQEQYHLTVISPRGDTNGTGWYNAGDTATASLLGDTMIGDSGTQTIFTGWTGDAKGAEPTSNPITMDGSKTARANWKTQYYLAVVSELGNPTGQGWYDAGSTATFSVNTPIPAGSGIQVVLSSWTESNGAQIEQKATVAITMSQSFSIRANWITQYQVSYAISGNALQIDAPSTEWVNAGAKPNGVFPATAINAAKDVKCVLISDDRPYTVNGPLTITAFYQTQYLVTFSQIGIEADSTGIIAIILGDEKPYQMLANATWITSGSSIDFSYSEIVESTNTSKKYILAGINYSSLLTIEEPITVLGIYEPQISSSLSLNTIALYVIPFSIPPPIAIVLLAFRKRKKKITPISNTGGVISPSTPQKIEPGGDSTVFIITAYPGYKIDDVVIDDTTHLGAIRTYKFIEVNGNHTISAVFSKN